MTSYFSDAAAGALSDGVEVTDDDRVVELDEDVPLLSEQTRDDTDFGWGEHSWDSSSSNDERLRAERPPHWD